MAEPIRLTRRELYDLIWSKPMRDVAEDLGISDVGLGKVCDRHRVPKPERGYWVKVSNGAKPKRAVFVEIDDGRLNRVEIRGALSQIPQPARQVLEDARRERKARTVDSRPKVMVQPSAPVTDVHKAISRTAQRLRKAKPNSMGGVRAEGDGLCGVQVGEQQIERAIAFLDSLARKLEAKGMPIEPIGTGMKVVRDKDDAVFTLIERTRREKHVPTEMELVAEERRQKKLQQAYRSPLTSWDLAPKNRSYPEFDISYSGELVLQVEGYADQMRWAWGDGKTQTVEAMLDNIVVGIEALLAARKARREEREERERQWQEMRRRRELARKRLEREAKRVGHIRRFMRVSEEARKLRTWLDQAELEIMSSNDVELESMLAWARQRLLGLEKQNSLAGIKQTIHGQRLFPEEDELHDPLGDPPGEPRYW